MGYVFGMASVQKPVDYSEISKVGDQFGWCGALAEYTLYTTTPGYYLAQGASGTPFSFFLFNSFDVPKPYVMTQFRVLLLCFLPHTQWSRWAFIGLFCYPPKGTPLLLYISWAYGFQNEVSINPSLGFTREPKSRHPVRYLQLLRWVPVQNHHLPVHVGNFHEQNYNASTTSHIASQVESGHLCLWAFRLAREVSWHHEITLPLRVGSLSTA